ncbi:MAG: HAMP domain-containing protein, partial [Deltaproteobacteria bacterium]|nr:HAMP domain-containing protein [Deltaproteobacteria bacterium]
MSTTIQNIRSKIAFFSAFPFAQAAPARRRGRLVRDYFLISVVLVGSGLLASGLVEIYFRYQETREQLALLQQEVAAGAAFKIERFVQEIHNTLKGATRSREIAPKGLTPEFRFELEKLLLIAPAVTEAVALDENGAIRVQASRLRTVLADAKKEFSTAPPFQQAKQGKSYFGPVHFVRGSEPYMTIAVSIERFAGEVIGVLQAEVNLKYIGDVVSGIKVGKAGHAYAVTRSGELIAHPDISLVLQRRNVGRLDQVKTAFHAPPGTPKPSAIIAQNLQGKEVFSSFALIPSLDWAVILERPVEEAYEPLYASMMRTSTLLLIGLGMALLASVFVGRRVVGPLRILREGAERIGAGDLGYRLDFKTSDEIGILAEEFNKMTAQLQESYANLEQKVEERTRELTEALEQQTATSEILQVIASSPTDLTPVLNAIAENAARVCDAKDVVIRLVEGNVLRLAAHHGPLEIGELELPIDHSSVVGRAMVERELVHVNDLLSITATEYPKAQPSTERYGIRTALAAPLLRRDVPIGTIFIRRTAIDPFTEKQIAMLKTFADQAVIAIENVRLFQEIQEKNQQLEIANRHKSQFLANVSHELRTPLNSIIGFTRIVLRRTEGQILALQKENLQKVLISAEHLLNLINGLLDLSKIEAGRMEVYAETFKLDEIIRVATSTVEPMLKDGRVHLITDIEPEIPPLKTDRDKLKQIILNLLSNSAKFTQEGEIRVSAWQENGTLKLVVSDTGIGMKKEALEYIFDEFRQADMSS